MSIESDEEPKVPGCHGYDHEDDPWPELKRFMDGQRNRHGDWHKRVRQIGYGSKLL